jgi:predicted nucleotidyltransferase
MRRTQSWDSVKIVFLDRPALVATLTEAAAALGAQCPEADEVRLFGSVARGRDTGLSDTDLLIIAREQPDDPLERLRRYHPRCQMEVGVDVVVGTREEMEHRLATGHRFLTRALADSQVLWRR